MNLTRGEQLDGEDAFHILDDLKALPGGESSHGHVIFLAGGGRQRVHGRRMTKHFVLGHQRGRRAMGQHEARLEAAAMSQEGRQFAVSGVD